MFLVIELQKDANGNVAHLITTHTTQADAESKFHTILAYAATSSLPSHSATILTDNGYALRREFYTHEIAPAPEPEPEGEGE